MSRELRVDSEDVTRLLRAWSDGDAEALNQLWPVIYQEVRLLARACMSAERSENTLQATALVHEAFLRLLDQQNVNWQNRQQFFAITSRMMRRILVDHARRRMSLKRGGRSKATPLDVAGQIAAKPTESLPAVDEALSALEIIDREKARIVELKFFGGLTNRETADVIGCSEKTVRRHWNVAKVWLYRELSSP